MNIKFFQAKIQTNASAKLDIMKMKINFAKNVIIPGWFFSNIFAIIFISSQNSYKSCLGANAEDCLICNE